MKNKIRTLGITTALAFMIPLSAYAATAGTSTDTKKEDSTWSIKGDILANRGGSKLEGEFFSQEVLDLLKLDKAALDAKIKSGATLAKIAEEQGVSRESLKSVMTDTFNKKIDEQKQNFADNLDKVIDSDLQAMKSDKFHTALDLTEASKLLGLSAADLKTQLASGKSLADLAADKGVDVQKLIDAQAAAIKSSIDQAVKDGKLTQEQADKQLAELSAMAEKIVNSKGSGEFRHGGGKGRGFSGDKPSTGTDAAEPSASS